MGSPVKLVTLLKRRPGMSREEFIDRYENGHRLIGEKYLAGAAVRYVRRYLEPLAGGEPEYDVLMEIWFPSRAVFDATFARLAEPAAAREITEDEEQLFDRPAMKSFIVEEYESVLPPI